MPTSIIQVINKWGKSHKNAEFKNKLEFWDRLKQNTTGRMMTSMSPRVRLTVSV